MERNEDEQDLDRANAQDPGQDIVGEGRSEDDGLGPDAANAPDRSAEPQLPADSLPPREAAPSADDPESSDARQEIAAPTDAATMQPGEQATRIEVPLDPDVSSATQPTSRPGDQLVRVPPPDRDEEPAEDLDPVDKIFSPEWQPPADSSASADTPKSAAGDAPHESIGTTIPRVQVLVMLLESKTMYADAIEEALEANASKYRQIAQSEVDQAFWNYDAQLRAIDWRLRGP